MTLWRVSGAVCSRRVVGWPCSVGCGPVACRGFPSRILADPERGTYFGRLMFSMVATVTDASGMSWQVIFSIKRRARRNFPAVECVSAMGRVVRDPGFAATLVHPDLWPAYATPLLERGQMENNDERLF